MKKNNVSILLFFTLFIFTDLIYANIEGIWHGNLLVSPGNELSVHFLIKKGEGSEYSAKLNSPSSEAISNIAADSVSFENNVLKIEVAELSGSFEGELKGGAIDGTWKQLDQEIALLLKPYEDKALSENLVAKVAGRWQGALKIPGMELSTVMIFETDDDGKITGNFASPDQGPTKFPMSEIVVTESSVSFAIKNIRGKYKGEFTDGEIVGEWSQGRSFPLTMSRAEFDPTTYALKWSGETSKLLSGNWYGEIKRPGNEMAVVLRFVQENDLSYGYMDFPDAGAKNMPLKEAELAGADVTITAGAIFDFKGKVEGETIVGEIDQRGQKIPVTLVKGDLPPLVLEIASSNHDLFNGSWKGKLMLPSGMITTVIRFDKIDGDKLIGFIDSPDQGMKGARITSASYDGGELTVNSSVLKMEYKAKLGGGDEFVGQVNQRGAQMDLKVKKQ